MHRHPQEMYPRQKKMDRTSYIDTYRLITIPSDIIGQENNSSEEIFMNKRVDEKYIIEPQYSNKGISHFKNNRTWEEELQLANRSLSLFDCNEINNDPPRLSPHAMDFHIQMKNVQRKGNCKKHEVTHRGAHRFVPRHEDEIAIEIGDPLHVDEEGDDLWCEGMNLRTGSYGIFPCVYATDCSIFVDSPDEDHFKQEMYSLQFLGSIQVGYHKGYDVLGQAIQKIVQMRNPTQDSNSACRLEITNFGIMVLHKDPLRDVDEDKKNHFFPLKNVSFSGCHPTNPRYFGFITKHPTETRFACHVFVGEISINKAVCEAVRRAFQRCVTEYMAFTHPTEDIYIE